MISPFILVFRLFVLAFDGWLGGRLDVRTTTSFFRCTRTCLSFFFSFSPSLPFFFQKLSLSLCPHLIPKLRSFKAFPISLFSHSFPLVLPHSATPISHRIAIYPKHSLVLSKRFLRFQSLGIAPPRVLRAHPQTVCIVPCNETPVHTYIHNTLHTNLPTYMYIHG